MNDETEQCKGHPFLNVHKANSHFRATVAPERGQLGPAGVQVPQSQTPVEFPATASSAMAHRVGLQPARTVNFLRSAFTKLL